MKITAFEIKQHEFEKSFRGYDIEEVDIFLNSLANEWERMSNENKMLRMQLEIAEKEASKLREVELTLIKTLQSAESTSSKITDQARIQADRKIADASLEAENIILKAKKEAEIILSSAKTEVSHELNKQYQAKANIEDDIISLENKRNSIIDELDRISQILQEIGPNANIVPKKKLIVEKDPIQTIENKEKVDDNDSEIEITSIASSANSISLEDESDKSNLEIIEGIGPKIKDLMNHAGIITYRDMATTPVYKLKEILETGGPAFAMHDPSTWVEQALLAEEGRWAELEDLKEKLVAGRKPKDETPSMASASVTEEKSEPARKEGESNTEEMLDRVNKVKAAIRKAMVEKETLNDTLANENKAETINERMARQRESEEKGSFFDNL